MTPTEFAELVASGDGDAVRQALAGDPNLASGRTGDGASMLQWAIYSGRRDLVSLLLESGAPVDLATACTIGDLGSSVRIEDPNELSEDGFRPVALAAAFGHNDLVAHLLASGADANLRSVALGGVSPIHAAVFGRNLDGLRLLVEAGGDVDATQEGGFTALMGAAQNGDLEMVDFLLERGANPEARTSEGKSAADFAQTDELRSILAGREQA